MDEQVPKNYRLNQAIGDGINRTWPFLEKYGWFALATFVIVWYFGVIPKVKRRINALVDGMSYDASKAKSYDEKMRKAREMQATVAEMESREWLERKRKLDEEARLKAAEDLEKRAVKMGLRPHRGGHRLGGGEGGGQGGGGASSLLRGA